MLAAEFTAKLILLVIKSETEPGYKTCPSNSKYSDYSKMTEHKVYALPS
jgi:hypothetical protein